MTEVIRAEQKPIVWMFSGQGAQYFQMGKALYDTNGTFRFWMDRLDQVAANYAGQSIVEMLYDEKQSKSQPFDQTLYTHPALFMVQYSLAKTLLAENLPPPDYLFGASLGEFVAATLADVADVEVMLFDIIKQARLFDSHCGGGAMLAILDDVDIFQTNPVFSGGCELAGVNFDRCFVVSGLRSKILAIAGQLKQQDIIHQLLPVSVAFHSSLVEVVRETFTTMFAGNVYRSAKIPVVSCAVSTGGGQDMNQGNERFSSAYWWQVIRQPIEFSQALAEFQRNHPQAVYLDLGPSGNMAALTKYNLPESAHKRIMPVMTPFGNDNDNIRVIRDKLRVPA